MYLLDQFLTLGIYACILFLIAGFGTSVGGALAGMTATAKRSKAARVAVIVGCCVMAGALLLALVMLVLRLLVHAA